MQEAEQQDKKKRRLPRGTSEYQAAWITEDIVGEGESSEDDEEEEGAAGHDDQDDVRCAFHNNSTHKHHTSALGPPWLVTQGHVTGAIRGLNAFESMRKALYVSVRR